MKMDENRLNLTKMGENTRKWPKIDGNRQRDGKQGNKHSERQREDRETKGQ